MYNAKIAEGHLLSDKMNVQLDVFCPPMMNGIGGHIHGRDVVTKDDGSLQR